MKVLRDPSSGSKAGSTASRNRYGSYDRSRVTPVNPNSTRQSAARSLLAAGSQSWQTLSDVQRTGWKSFADAHPRTDSLGSTITLTGHQAYVGLYCALINAGLTPSDDAPGGEAPAAPAFTVTTLAADEATLAITPTPVPADTALVIEAAAPVSPGVNFVKDYRKIWVVAAGTAVTAYDVIDFLTDKFGTIPVGKKIFFRLTLVDANGASAPTIQHALVGA